MKCVTRRGLIRGNCPWRGGGAVCAGSGGITFEPRKRFARGVSDGKLPARRNVRERLREAVHPIVCAARIDFDGPARPGTAPGGDAAVSACAGGARCGERKTIAARKGSGSRGI